MEPERPGCEAAVAFCNEAWHRHRARSALESNLNRAGIPEEEFWAHYGSWVAAMQGEYPGALLERVKTYVRTGGTVLDIGAGAGAFAIPLAAMSRRVTAVEPSPAQVAQLTAAIERAQVANIDIVENPWEARDIDTPGSYDMVLAVHSFQMKDIAASLRRMCAAASQCVLLIHTAGHSLSALSRDLFDIEPGPDYTHLHHILLGLGYAPTVEFVDYSYDVPLDVQLDILRYNPGLDDTQCAALRDHLVSRGSTTVRNGTLWLRRAYRDALMAVTAINDW
jgi:SAM-dependent methyltransferase